jgi:hypothetical protein
MSLSTDRQFVVCDGPGCQARTKVPVALRRTLNGGCSDPEVSGWLYITRGADVRHYCADCKRTFLERLTQPDVPMKQY